VLPIRSNFGCWGTISTRPFLLSMTLRKRVHNRAEPDRFPLKYLFDIFDFFDFFHILNHSWKIKAILKVILKEYCFAAKVDWATSFCDCESVLLFSLYLSLLSLARFNFIFIFWPKNPIEQSVQWQRKATELECKLILLMSRYDC
jgi:hypothetical protein